MDPLISSVSGRRSIEREAASDAHAAAKATYDRNRTWLIVATLVALAAAAAMLRVGMTLKRMVGRTRARHAV